MESTAKKGAALPRGRLLFPQQNSPEEGDMSTIDRGNNAEILAAAIQGKASQ